MKSTLCAFYIKVFQLSLHLLYLFFKATMYQDIFSSKAYWRFYWACKLHNETSYFSFMDEDVFRYDIDIYMKMIDHRGNATIYTESAVQCSIVCNWQFRDQWNPMSDAEGWWRELSISCTAHCIWLKGIFVHTLARQKSSKQNSNFNIQHCTIFC